MQGYKLPVAESNFAYLHLNEKRYRPQGESWEAWVLWI